MRLHVLGCGDAFGSGGRNQSGYLVEAPDRMFLIDCGPTTLLAMKRADFDPCRLDAVFLSHLHGDHMAGIPFLLLSYLYEKPRPTPLEIAGPNGTQARVTELFRLMYGSAAITELPPVQFHDLAPGKAITIAGIDVVPFRVPHQTREVSLGLRLSYSGKHILFSGDSAWTELFVTHARGADLFLCECSFYERETPNHMSYRRLRDQAPRLECKKLVLTHLSEEMLARRHEIPFTLAEDGMVLEL